MADLVPAQPKKKGLFYILRHWREILAKDEALADREQSVVKKEEEMVKRESDALSREQQVSRKDKEVSAREAQVTEKDERLTQMEQELKRKEDELKHKEEELKVKEEEIARRESQVKQYEDFESEQKRQEEEKEKLAEASDVLLSEEDKEGISKDERISRGTVIKRFKDLMSQDLIGCEYKVKEIKRVQKIKEDTIQETEGLSEQEKTEKFKEVREASKKDRIMTFKMMEIRALAHTAVYIDRGEKTPVTKAMHDRIVNKVESICKGLDKESQYELKRQYMSTILEDTGFYKGFDEIVEVPGRESGRWCLDRHWESAFPRNRMVGPVDLFGFEVEDGGRRAVYPGVVQSNDEYKDKHWYDFVASTPSELVRAASEGLESAATLGLHIFDNGDQWRYDLRKTIQANLIDVGFASPNHISSLGLKEVKGAEAHIESLNKEDGAR